MSSKYNKSTPSPAIAHQVSSPTPTSIHSHSSITPTKQLVKKFQSQMKTCVHNYGNLIMTWMNTGEQVVILLNYCKELLMKKTSIVRTLVDSPFILKIFKDNHKNINNQLCTSIHREIEHSLIQIVSFQRRLKDILCAMILAYDEMQSMITHEGVDIFQDDGIYQLGHFFSIQRLHRGYLLEVERKLALTSYLFGHSSSSSTSSSTNHQYEHFDYDHRDHQYDLIQIETMISSFPDKAIDSFIDTEQGYSPASLYLNLITPSIHHNHFIINHFCTTLYPTLYIICGKSHYLMC